MKVVNAAVSNEIRSSHNVNAVPRLTVEWNFNRYVQNVTSDNTPPEDSDGFDIEAFPIESIIMPNRPTAGILKARVGEARVADPYTKVTGIGARVRRSYLGSTEDTYKYWTSPVPTDSLGVFPTNGDGTSKCRPRVDYPDGILTNRIVIGFEDSFAAPNDFTVRIKTDVSGTLTTISTNPIINSEGQVILNWNGTSWSSGSTYSEDISNMPKIYGVEVRVDSLKGVAGGSSNGANTHLSLIEISARRVHDLTDRLEGVNDTFDMSEQSFVYPVGTLTSNGGEISLFNGDGALNAENVDSPYYGLMEPNAKFNLDWIYMVDGSSYVVPEFEMYGGPWMGQRAESVSVELTDYSKFFQEINPRPACYLNVTVSEIVWRLCDSIGFVSYEIQTDDVTTDNKIKVWYNDGTKTMWELLDDLAKGTQTAIYFDSYGKLQVRTRTNAFNDAGSVNWTLRANDNGTELADIVSIEQTDELSSNKISVTYQTTDVDPIINGQSKTQVLWQADGTVALRACALYATLNTADSWFVIPPADAKIWPYAGMVNIEGEFIKYNGKVYIYYVNGVRKVITAKSVDDVNKANASSNASERARNFFDGRMIIEERAVWNTVNKQHSVDASGYSVRAVVNNKGHYLNVGGFSHNRAQSRVYITSGPHQKDGNDLLVVTRGSQSDPGFYQYGTKIRFEKNGGKTQEAGLVFHNQQGNLKPGNDEDGYYIDVVPTSKMTARVRSHRNEVALIVRNGGKFKTLSKGAAFNIAEGVDYEIDVQFKIGGGGNHIITVWINGKQAYSVTVTGGDIQPFNGKFGMFTRGSTKASYEYLYAINRPPAEDSSDDFSFLDRISGGNVGGQLDREAIYGWRTIRKRVKKRWTKIQDLYMVSFYDEFGPIVHEIREFDVKFTKGPAITARPYITNDWSAVCPEFYADAYSAHFYVANASRQTVILNGDDNITYAGSGASINQILSVIGRSVTVKEAESVEVKNDFQIRKRGEIETEISSTWIQSKAQAQEIANWIKGHWSEGADEQQVTIFGNPLLELGDIVTIDYPEMDMSPTTHKYFVVSVKNSFDTGLETNLTLRRVIV